LFVGSCQSLFLHHSKTEIFRLEHAERGEEDAVGIDEREEREEGKEIHLGLEL
jgi:hypothetical protein